MKKYFTLAAIVLLVALIINQYLGGFNTLDSKIVALKDFQIYGRWFDAGTDNDSLKQMVNRIRRDIQDKKLTGDLTIISYFNTDNQKQGTVKQLVGVTIENGKQVPEWEGFELHDFSLARAVRTRVKIQGLVMPSPEKIKHKAEAIASIEGATIQGFSIERYSDQWLIVDIPLN